MPPASPQVFDPAKTNTDFFWYEAEVAGLSSVAPAGNALINLDADSYFFLCAITAIANIAGAAFTESTAPLPLVKMQITDTSNGKSLSNGGLMLPALVGDGKRPYRLVRPRVFKPNGTIQLTFDASEMAAGTTYGIQVIFHGWKQYLGGVGG
ncbi:MAG: hypothetical protein ACYDDA_03790 [Acidiferrobacteraceae bacterium]